MRTSSRTCQGQETAAGPGSTASSSWQAAAGRGGKPGHSVTRSKSSSCLRSDPSCAELPGRHRACFLHPVSQPFSRGFSDPKTHVWSSRSTAVTMTQRLPDSWSQALPGDERAASFHSNGKQPKSRDPHSAFNQTEDMCLLSEQVRAHWVRTCLSSEEVLYQRSHHLHPQLHLPTGLLKGVGGHRARPQVQLLLLLRTRNRQA